MLYYFVEFAGSFANIALLLLFIGRLFPKKEPVSRWFYAYVALLIAGQCALSLFPDWVTQRTIYLLVGGFFLALLFYEVRPWQAVFASGAFFTLIALVEVLAMLLIGLRIPDTDILMQAGAARLVYVVFSNLIQIPLVVLISHFFSRKGNALRILWLLPIIAIQIASIAVCYVAQYHAADEYFPDYMVGLMAVLLLINILIVFYVEALRENELEKFKVKFNEQQYNLQMEYYQQLKERQEEVRSLRHDVKKYILAMQAVAEHGDTEELHKIAQAATDVFERSTNISAVGNPVVDALLNYYLRIAERNNINVKLDVTIPEVLTISSLSLSIEKTIIVAGGGEETLTAVFTLLAQCSKVGSNLNQLARHFNSGGADTEQIRAKLLDELADLTAFRLHAEKVLGELYGNAQAYRLSRKGSCIVQP